MEVFSSPKSLVLIRQVKCTLSEKFFSEEQTQSDKSVCNLLPPPFCRRLYDEIPQALPDRQTSVNRTSPVHPRVFIPLSAFL